MNLAITAVPTTGQDVPAVRYAPGMTPSRIRIRRGNPLMGAREAADYLGVDQQNLRPIPGLPAPIQTLRCGSIWLAEDIEQFALAIPEDVLQERRERLAQKRRERELAQDAA